MFTEQDLAAVRAAIAKGVRRVEYADRSVTYQSVDDLLRAEARITQALAGAGRQKQSILVGEKGL